jgi:hypothetical protein
MTTMTTLLLAAADTTSQPWPTPTIHQGHHILFHTSLRQRGPAQHQWHAGHVDRKNGPSGFGLGFFSASFGVGRLALGIDGRIYDQVLCEHRLWSMLGYSHSGGVLGHVHSVIL